MNLHLQYRLPTPEDELLLYYYVEEHRSVGERDISAGMGLDSMTYAQWLEETLCNAVHPNGKWGRSDLLLGFLEGELVGLLSVRYELADALRQKYGDIGYGVRPARRRQGFAAAMLRHGLDVCREHGMSDAIVGCYKDNLASVRTILNNRGKLVREDDGYTKGRLSQYYQISLAIH